MDEAISSRRDKLHNLTNVHASKWKLPFPQALLEQAFW